MTRTAQEKDAKSVAGTVRQNAAGIRWDAYMAGLQS